MPATSAEKPAGPGLTAARLMRIASPIRLPAQPGPELEREVAEVRSFLDTLQKAGFDSAMWVVDSVPSDPEVLKRWVASCLKAFPGKLIITLDRQSGDKTLSPGLLKPFLQLVLSHASGDPSPVFRPAISSKSVMLNYIRMNNCACEGDHTAPIEGLAATARLVREVSPRTFIWLFVEDCQKSAGKIPPWIRGLGPLADGYYFHHGHGMKAINDSFMASTTAPWKKTGKPILRGGFGYTTPRLRPGLEEALREQYADRMGRYERWLVDMEYAGYSREFADGDTGKFSVNVAYVPEY
jgi:hypothetical protein